MENDHKTWGTCYYIPVSKIHSEKGKQNMPKLLPGELVIIEYIDGQFVNRWGVITNKAGIDAVDGRTVQVGNVDFLYEGEAGSTLVNNRIHAVGSLESLGVSFLTDAGFSKQWFANKELTVLELLNTTDIFNSSGVKIGTLPGGVQIGIETGSAGYSNRHMMSVNAYNDGSGWKFLNQTNYSYGFINLQLGFGTKMYNSVRTVETVKSYVANKDLNWAEIGSVRGYETIESYLRNLTGTESDVFQAVNDYFAGVDLNAEGVIVGDGSLFFESEKASFIERKLIGATLTTTATKFMNEKANFEAL